MKCVNSQQHTLYPRPKGRGFTALTDKNADKYMELVGSLAIVSVVVTFIIALFVNYS